MGCLANNSPWGIWEITEQGRRQYSEWVEFLKQNFSKSDEK
jgi:hypothetical protein